MAGRVLTIVFAVLVGLCVLPGCAQKTSDAEEASNFSSVDRKKDSRGGGSEYHDSKDRYGAFSDSRPK